MSNWMLAKQNEIVLIRKETIVLVRVLTTERAIGKRNMPAGSAPERTIFVTVGTTLFAALMEVMTDARLLQQMVDHGYTHLILQYGKGPKPSLDHVPPKLHVECYDFKPSLHEDMLRADVLVGHAGAGTLTEALRLSSEDPKRRTIVTVINNQLMDNHQTELAYALQRRRLVHVLDAPDDWLNETQGRRIWQHIVLDQATVNQKKESLLQGDPYDVPRILYNFLGQEYAPTK
jgi:beta-1,4-N-acetylglucosaminyltransferase